MKKLLLILILLAAAAAGLVVAYKKMSQERETGKNGEAPVVADSRVKRAADGALTLALDAETQNRIALQTVPLAPATLAREIKAYGRVLDPGPLAVQVSDVVSAQVALEASKKEWLRLKRLYENGENAPKRAVDAAEATFRRDEVAWDAARIKVMTAWGAVFMPGVGLPSLLEPLVAHQHALVRLDLPAGETTAPPRFARLFALADSERPIGAEYLAPAANVDAQAQSQGLLFLVKSNAGGLRPGQALIGFVQQPGEPLHGVMVPPSAVIRVAGKAWVYVQTADTTFTRREVLLDHPTDAGWLVTSGLKTTDRIVVTGAQTLFSEELKSRIQVGE